MDCIGGLPGVRKNIALIRSESTDIGEWSGWIAAVVGLWILITPFFWGSGGAGGVNWLFWSNSVSSIVAVLAGWTAS